MRIEETMSISEKLKILSDAAKYDVACTSSGVQRKGVKGAIGNTAAAGICHSFAADGRCISLLKILMTNECVFDCKYCVNRASRDTKRATFTPAEICTLTMEFYKRNYIFKILITDPEQSIRIFQQFISIGKQIAMAKKIRTSKSVMPLSL